MTQDTHQKVKLTRRPESVQPCPAPRAQAGGQCPLRMCPCPPVMAGLQVAVLCYPSRQPRGKAVLEALAASGGRDGSPSPCSHTPPGIWGPLPTRHPLFTYPQRTLLGQASGKKTFPQSLLKIFPVLGFGRDPQGSPEPLPHFWGVEISGAEEISGSHS